jgi:molybdopterin molybdotransferase
MISIDEAVKMILDSVPPAGTETVPLTEAYGRILAEEIRADSDVPYSDNSAMDGFAVCAESVAGASEESPAELEIVGEIAAGGGAGAEVRPGAAVRIMTGAQAPRGADAVVMIEYTETRGGVVLVKAPVKSAANIRLAGEDIKKNQLLFSAGRKIGAADAGVMASAGYKEIKVGRRPVVGVISTGDEVVEPDEAAGPGKVRNSNSYTLYALALSAGASPRYLGIIPDRREAVEAAFRGAARECDVILTSGGVSAGDYDFVKEILGEIGDVRFWKVSMKPGRPIAFGRVEGKPLFGLPGNPVSVMVGFEMFVRPALLKMAGAAEIFRRRTSARAEHDIADKPERTKIFRGIATHGAGGATVRTTGSQGSGVLTSMVLANCLIVVPDGTAVVKKGETVEVIPLDGFPV